MPKEVQINTGSSPTFEDLSDDQKLDVVVELATNLICAVAGYIHGPSVEGREEISEALRRALIVGEVLG